MSHPHHRSPAAPKRDAVMISSTYLDLKELRKVLEEAALGAGLFPEAMEHDAARTVSIIESSLAKIRGASAYVLLIGHRYGQQPKDAATNPDRLSITELEFNEAIRLGLPIVVLSLGQRYPIGAEHVERTKTLVKKLEAFRRRAQSMDGSGSGVSRVYAEVDTPEELGRAAERTLQGLAKELATRLPATATPSAPDPAAQQEQPRPAPPAPHAVPPYIGSHAFVGRSAELALLDDWAAPEGQHPLLLFDAIGGSGKSMLTWHWFEHHAPRRRPWAGRFWYSFYEPGASMADCCREALAYLARQPIGGLQKQPTRELGRQLVAHLRSQPCLLVLDGLERVLVAYHRSDAPSIADEALERPSDQMADRDPCAAAHPDDDELLRQLSVASPSKLLVSSRLMPQALLNQAHQPIPGVRREPLRGLRPADAVLMLRRCCVHGDAAAMQRYLQAHCDGHPLVVGALAGLIAQPYPAGGDFNTWLAHPAGGAALDLGALDLTQKRNHILRAALAAVPPKGRELLGTLALLHGGIDALALEALNPHRPAEPEEVEEPLKPEEDLLWGILDDQEKAEREVRYSQLQAARVAYLRAHAAWEASPEVKVALAALGQTLVDLQRRGLLQAGEDAERRFDLHPVVRGIVSSGLAGIDTQRLGQRVVDHFSRRAHSPYEQAQTLQDLEGGLQIVRTLLRMGRFQEALSAWQGDLSVGVALNLQAWHETLAVLKPFFPSGWLQAPVELGGSGAGGLMNQVAWALNVTGLRTQAIQLYGAVLRLAATLRDGGLLHAGLGNLASTLEATSRLEEAHASIKLGFRMGEVEGYARLHRSCLDRLRFATTVGNWPEAEELWTRLQSMNQHFSRGINDPGDAQFERSLNLWNQGRPIAEWLSAAERLSRESKDRGTLRNALDLRGEWRLKEGDALGAITALEESARLARATGLTDLDTETWLALARHHAGQLDAPGAEAERLQAAGAEGYALVRLWLAAGDTVCARAQALKYHRWAWADGEPYVRRFDLERARRLLAELGEAEPKLPPYDPANRKRFDWQDEVEAAITALEREKAERDAEATRREAEKTKKAKRGGRGKTRNPP